MLFTKTPPSLGLSKPLPKHPLQKDNEQGKDLTQGLITSNESTQLKPSTGLLGLSSLTKSEKTLSEKPQSSPVIPLNTNSNPFLNPNLNKVPTLPGLGVSPIFQKQFTQPSPGITSSSSTQGTPTINEGGQRSTFARGFPPTSGSLV